MRRDTPFMTDGDIGHELSQDSGQAGTPAAHGVTFLFALNCSGLVVKLEQIAPVAQADRAAVS